MAALPKKLTSYAAAASAVVIGIAGAAQAALRVYDYRDAPIHTSPIGNYEVGPIPHDAAILYMDGTFKRSTNDGATYTYYDQDGLVTTPIDAADKTADAVWFTYHDFRSGGRAWGGSFLSAGPGGGVAANLIIDGELREGSAALYEVYNSAHGTGLEGVATQVDGDLNYTTGPAVVAGGGGVKSYGWGWGGNLAYTKGFWGTGFVGFSLLEEDGLHYGWVQVATGWRVHNMTIYGWAYQTIANLPAELDYTVLVPTGDFDEDGDIDSDDIGLLCANITGSGNPPNDPKYDLDGDGDTDQDDMDMLIHDLVEITGGDGTGTEYGDFDLDGDIDTTDLTILATNFGLGTTWSEGNANCDLVIDTTDLAILATNFGFVASGAVPEPATLSLLAVGSAALIRRRRATP